MEALRAEGQNAEDPPRPSHPLVGSTGKGKLAGAQLPGPRRRPPALRAGTIPNASLQPDVKGRQAHRATGCCVRGRARDRLNGQVRQPRSTQRLQRRKQEARFGRRCRTQRWPHVRARIPWPGRSLFQVFLASNEALLQLALGNPECLDARVYRRGAHVEQRGSACRSGHDTFCRAERRDEVGAHE